MSDFGGLYQGIAETCKPGFRCVDPAMFHDLCRVSDAIQLGILCFIAGYGLCMLFDHIAARMEYGDN